MADAITAGGRRKSPRLEEKEKTKALLEKQVRSHHITHLKTSRALLQGR